MASKSSIANMALGHCGVSQTIIDVDTERSVEARQCRTYYDQNVDFVLRSFDWPFATAYGDLALVSDDANDDWQYSYRYPPDALTIRRVATTLGRLETKPPPFVVGQDAQGKLIYSSQADAVVEYTVKVTDPGRFDPLFVEALAWKLAADIAPALSRIKDRGAQCYAMFLQTIGLTEVVVANEQQRDPQRESEFITVRE